MMKVLRVMAILAAITFSLLPANLLAANPPQPTYGTATVDGDSGEWDLSADLFANMHEAGNPTKDLLSKLYLRYDCVEELLYVLVLVEPGYDGQMDEDNAWIKFYDIANSAAPWEQFSWIGPDLVENTVRGYEAATQLPPGDYTGEKIEAHIQVVSDRTSSTGRPLENRPDLVIECDLIPPTSLPVPGLNPWGAAAATGLLVLFAVLTLRPRSAAAPQRSCPASR